MAFELDSNNFKIRLKEVRKTRKLTQQELAAKQEYQSLQSLILSRARVNPH